MSQSNALAKHLSKAPDALVRRLSICDSADRVTPQGTVAGHAKVEYEAAHRGHASSIGGGFIFGIAGAGCGGSGSMRGLIHQIGR